ncbi:Outer membrane protein ImpK/VasF, OmpA/MotB domain [hydrothermal vent metagenome]|uniref:Outer membrane protein ImpK/VasF, OmpA/MotB domain n=1 Tax=hydrothermal vent metagenome TaxID=652676 RepID=A0A3B0X5P9_9ZZZZ
MSSDDSDKTVFRQPSVDGDRTVIRPMPGGRGGHPPQQQQPVQQPPPSQQPDHQYQASQPSPQMQSRASAYFSTSSGLNPLVNAASTLIAVFETTRSSLSHPDVGGLHQRLVNEIGAFESAAKQIGIHQEMVVDARYVACVALDEAVLNTPWGAQSGWSQRTLLRLFHNETSGGAKFFKIMETMKDRPAENLFLLELIYIFISLGVEGKYRLEQRGRETIEQIRDELFTTIRRQRGEYERSLSPSWQGLGRTNNSLTQYIPMWVVASIIGAVLFLSYSGFRFWLYESSSPVVTQLDEITDMRTIARKTPES